MKKLLTAVLPLAGVLLAGAAHAQDEPMSRETLLSTFGWDFDAVEITTEKVDDGLYVLFGAGGNIAVSVGDQGVLIVDDMFPELMPKIEAAIAEIGGDGVDFAVNTHWHFDHADGNLALGPAGSWIVAQENSTQMMAKSNVLNMVMAKYLQEAYPEDARPAISFDDRMRFYFNGGQIELVHTGPAHTAGDAAVIFRKHNAVHMGDVFNNTGYPFIDADSGGDIDGMIAFCQAVLDEVGPDATIIPGHGPIVGTEVMAAYIEMLTTVRDRVAAMIAEGKTLEEVVEAKPTADLDEQYGDVGQSLGFIDRVYTSLSK